MQLRLLRLKSVFLGDPHLHPVEVGREGNLARQARELVAVVARIEQVVLVLDDRRQLAEERRIDLDVAGGARAEAAAQREQLVEPVVADRFHHRKPVDRFDGALFTGAGDDGQLGHFIPFPVALPGAARQSRREWQAEGPWG